MRLWKDETLGELCALITDGKHGDCRNEEESGYYFISCKDVRDGRIHYENARQIAHADFAETHRRTNLSPGDILLTNSGTIGRLAVAPDDEKTQRTTFQKSVAILKPISERVTSSFLYYALAADRARLINSAGGAAQKNLLLGALRRFPIRVPPLGEQAKIASILSAYDDLIENNRRRIQLLEQAARLLYKEWFVHLRFPGHEHVTITDGVPEGWERKTLPEVIDINPKEAVPKETAIRYIPMAALSTSGMAVDLSNEERRSKATSVRFRNGDTLLARITPCLENGKTGFVGFLDRDEVACGSTEFIVLRGNAVSDYFTYCLARTHDFRETAIKSMTGSSGRQRVQPACFDDYLIPLPPGFLLDQFDETSGSIFNQIGGLTAQTQLLAEARDLLLPRLMNGEVVV